MNAKATQRAEVIFQVRSGQMTATEVVQVLGLSRQQYYQWEQREDLPPTKNDPK